MTLPLRGLTWDHPRGYAALDAIARADRSIDWERQPLSGFEERPLADLADDYDVLVIDHPHVGSAAGALAPIDELFDVSELHGWRDAFVGRSFDSYDYAGHVWALPLDAAAQVSVVRPDLLDGVEPPPTWADVEAFSRVHPMCLSLQGPHALLTFFSICIALGAPPVVDVASTSVSHDVGEEALSLMVRLFESCDQPTSLLDPIGILDALAAEDAAVAYCPLVFGYVTYARANDARKALRFVDAPVAAARGSVLGGTGLAVSLRAAADPRALSLLRQLSDVDTQTGTIPGYGGQPSRRAAWQSPQVDTAWNGFYSGTLATLEAAWVRPRYPGFPRSQAAASDVVRTGLLDSDAPSTILIRLEQELHDGTEHG